MLTRIFSSKKKEENLALNINVGGELLWLNI